MAPDNATDKTVEWSSSDETVATVADGKVTAVAPGTATITVKTKDGGKTATCEVTVVAKTIPVEEVTIGEATLELTEGDEAAITVTVTPEEATDKAVTYSSSDESVVTVDAEGKVIAVGPGTATITVTTNDGGKTATCEVTVEAKVIPVEEISFAEAKVTVIEGQSAKVEVSFNPENATNKAVTFESSDESVATVDAEGNVTGVKPGKATVTVTTEDGGKTATCEVTVEKKPVAVTKVTLNRTELAIEIGGEAQLVATVAPSDATNKKVTWTSSNESVVKVDQNGEVKAVKKGTATITVTTEDGGKTAKCEVTVTDEYVGITGIKLNKTSATVAMGKTEQLTATVSPTNATDHSITWESSNTSVATVDKTGKVTPVKPGSATITVKTKNNKSATCKVTVVQLVESIKILSSGGNEISSITRDIWYGGSSYGTAKLSASVSPSNATNKTVKWTSSNTSVATVDNTGKITYKKPGTTTIKVTAQDGSNVSKSITYIIYEGVADKITLTSSGGTGNFKTRVNGTFTVTAKLSVQGRWTPLVNEVTWSLSSTSSARIESYTATTCTIKGISATSASSPVILTAKAKSGDATVSQQISIVNPPYITSISLSPSTLNAAVGSTYEITPSISPVNGDVMELTWSSSNTSVATVTRLNSGKASVKALKTGTATITCTAPVTGAKATMTVKATKANAITSISFKNYSYSSELGMYAVTISKGSTKTISATISPSNADVSQLKWTIPNSSVATIVSQSGNSCVVKGVAAGNIQLICKDNDTGKQSTLGISVK